MTDLSRDEALAALAWLTEAGVDTVVEAEPRRWLDPPPPGDGDREAVEGARPLTPPPPSAAPLPVPGRIEDLAGVEAATSLEALRAAVDAIRPGAIFADGDPASKVMIVGECPAPDDRATGRPFSGPSGALLDKMLKSIGRGRSNAYLANLLLWRVANAKAASPEECAIGLAVLRRHIALARPKAVLVMSDAAGKALFELKDGITKYRGQWRTLEVGGLSIPVLPTFNPAYLLRMPSQKALAWRDLLAFKAKLDAD